jgi:hypothetical protein
MPDLKLIAFDALDLGVISAHLQDAVLRVGDIAYLPKEKRFVAIANRFDWAHALDTSGKAARGVKADHERRRAAVRFERVNGAQVQGVDLKDKRTSLALLAVMFEPTGGDDSPEGNVTLTFSGGAAIRLSVECIEIELQDLGAAWATKRPPEHSEDSNQ